MRLGEIGQNRPLVFGTPEGLKQSDLRKIRMMGLSDSERISLTGSAVLIQYTRVTDVRTTELPWHIYALQTSEPYVTIGHVTIGLV